MEDKFLNKAGVERLWANICTLLKESIETVDEQKVSTTIVDSLPTDNIIPNMIYLIPVTEAPPMAIEIDEEVADDEV